MYHYSFFLPAPWGSKVGGGLKEFDTCCGLAVLWAKNLDEDGKVLWNLGPPVLKIYAWNVFSFGPGACQKKPKMKRSGAQSLKVWNVCKPYYLLHLSHVGDLRGQSSEGRRGSFGGFFEKLRRSSALNANVGAVSSCTCVATGVPWALLGSTWTRSKGHRMAQVFAFFCEFLSFLRYS